MCRIRGIGERGALAAVHGSDVKVGKKVLFLFRQHHRYESTHFVQHADCCLNKMPIEIPIDCRLVSAMF